MDDIHSWWDTLPGERFWLGVTERLGDAEMLATPCGHGRGGCSRESSLLRHVGDGDVVFHYDVARAGIVAWSASQGRVRKQSLAWQRNGAEPSASRTVPSWTIGLKRATPLEPIVTLARIARIQSDLFPALQSFEDGVGAPLDYPFAMGSAETTHVLAGRVFKLPALFVAACPELTAAAERVSWFAVEQARVAAGRERAGGAPVPARREFAGGGRSPGFAGR